MKRKKRLTLSLTLLKLWDLSLISVLSPHTTLFMVLIYDMNAGMYPDYTIRDSGSHASAWTGGCRLRRQALVPYGAPCNTDRTTGVHSCSSTTAIFKIVYGFMINFMKGFTSQYLQQTGNTSERFLQFFSEFAYFWE